MSSEWLKKTKRIEDLEKQVASLKVELHEADMRAETAEKAGNIARARAVVYKYHVVDIDDYFAERGGMNDLGRF